MSKKVKKKIKFFSRRVIKFLVSFRGVFLSTFSILSLIFIFGKISFGPFLILFLFNWFIILIGFGLGYEKTILVGLVFLALSPVFLIFKVSSIAERFADISFFLLFFGVTQNLVMGKKDFG